MEEEFEVLTPELIEDIKKAFALAERARAELARAQAAGLDVSELVKRLNENETKLRQLAAAYKIHVGVTRARRSS
ncbi:MAG: hypothetical protein QXX41_10355 [Nitrososphaerota archaeon]